MVVIQLCPKGIFGPSTTQCCICSIVNNTTLVHYRLPCADLKKNEITSGRKNGGLLYYHFSLFCTVCTVLWESVTDIGGSVECCPNRHPAVASMYVTLWLSVQLSYRLFSGPKVFWCWVVQIIMSIIYGIKGIVSLQYNDVNCVIQHVQPMKVFNGWTTWKAWLLIIS